MNSEKWVLAIATGKHQRPLIYAAQEEGFKVLGIDKNPDNSIADKHLKCSTYDHLRCLNEIKEIIKYVNLFGVIARVSGPAVVTAAKIADHYKLKSYGSLLANSSLSKHDLYKTCTYLKIPSIFSEIVENPAEIRKLSNFVIKPDIPIHGKKNVFHCQNDKSFLRKFHSASEESLNRKVVVQPYIEGIDIIAATIVIEGAPLWIHLINENVNEINGKYYNSKVSNASPCTVRNAKNNNLAGAIARLFRYWNCTGFVFLSFKYTNNGTFVLYEVNPGLCGDDIAEGYLNANFTDANFFNIDVKVMTGEYKNLVSKSMKAKSLI